MNTCIINCQLEHVGIAAKDTRSLAQWYCDVFALHIVYQTDTDNPIFFLAHPNSDFKLEIFPLDSSTIFEEKGVHISFKVTNLEQSIEYLSKKNIKCGAVKHLMQNGKTVFFNDPIGHILQIVERPIPLW